MAKPRSVDHSEHVPTSLASRRRARTPRTRHARRPIQPQWPTLPVPAGTPRKRPPGRRPNRRPQRRRRFTTPTRSGPSATDELDRQAPTYSPTRVVASVVSPGDDRPKADTAPLARQRGNRPPVGRAALYLPRGSASGQRCLQPSAHTEGEACIFHELATRQIECEGSSCRQSRKNGKHFRHR